MIPNTTAMTSEDFMVNAVSKQVKTVKIWENTKLFCGIYNNFNVVNELARNKVSTGTRESQHLQKQPSKAVTNLGALSWHVSNNNKLKCSVKGTLFSTHLIQSAFANAAVKSSHDPGTPLWHVPIKNIVSAQVVTLLLAHN